MAWFGTARYGKDVIIRKVGLDRAPLGLVGLGKARQGPAWQGKEGIIHMARRDRAGLGRAGQDRAWLGAARHGWHHSQGAARPGQIRLGKARSGAAGQGREGIIFLYARRGGKQYGIRWTRRQTIRRQQ